MREMKALLIVLGVLAIPSHAFFNFLKKGGGGDPSTAAVVVEPVADPSHVRGVPEHLQHNYKLDAFVCDNGATVLRGDAVNDGFCDCRDGSDEPGTSACSNGVFYCINKGYKLTKLASSRVDDGVCDCCDGSDEGVIARCPNTCKEAADRERSAMQKMLSSYRIGSSLREQLVSTAKEDRAKLIAQIEPLTTQLSAQREEMKAFEALLNEKEQTKRTAQQEVENALLSEISGLLQLSSAPLDRLAQLLLNLLEAANKAESELRSLISFSIPSAYWSHSGMNSSPIFDVDVEIDDEEALHSADYLHDEDRYSDSDGDDLSPSPPPIADENNEETNCDIINSAQLGSYTENAGKKLRLLCYAPEKEKELRDVIIKLVKNARLETEAMLLLGFHALNQHFVGSADYAKNHIDNQGKDTCPVDFENIAGHCELKNKLVQLIDRLALASQDSLDPELQRIRDDVDTRRRRINELERNVQEAEKARNDLEKYKDHLDLLAMKGQCFEVIDGKFSYNLCMLENIRQKEIEGHGNVSLGEFDSVEDVDEEGASFKLHFKHGQYCHAFGPRSADVTVVCGEKNVLRAAREPSTCFYTLVLESPSACTPKFALTSGLTPFL